MYSRSFTRNSQWTEFDIHCYHVFFRTNANGGSPEVNLSLSFEDDNTGKATLCIFVMLIHIESIVFLFWHSS